MDNFIPIWLFQFFWMTTLLQLGLLYSMLLTRGCFTVSQVKRTQTK